MPEALGALADPPAELHVRGTWPAGLCVAIVGARAATEYGRAFAHRLAADLATLGIVIVSGLARGIDAAAHRGALDAGGITVAVLPGSLDRITPPSHAELAERIVLGRGALVAEWERDVNVKPGLFLKRNRLIAGLSLATVVVEAADRSGALATAAIARKLGRPVLAVPGDTDRPSSRGCNALLRAGTLWCESARDVLEALGPVALAPRVVAQEFAFGAGARETPDATAMRAGLRESAQPIATAAAHDEPAVSDAARVAAILDAEPRELGAVSRRAGLVPERVLAALLELQWAGVAATHPGPRWSAGRGGPGGDAARRGGTGVAAPRRGSDVT